MFCLLARSCSDMSPQTLNVSGHWKMFRLTPMFHLMKFNFYRGGRGGSGGDGAGQHITTSSLFVGTHARCKSCTLYNRFWSLSQFHTSPERARAAVKLKHLLLVVLSLQPHSGLKMQQIRIWTHWCSRRAMTPVMETAGTHWLEEHNRCGVLQLSRISCATCFLHFSLSLWL